MIIKKIQVFVNRTIGASYKYNIIPLKDAILQLYNKQFYVTCLYQLLYIFLFFMIVLFTYLYLQYNFNQLNIIGDELKSIKENIDSGVSLDKASLPKLPEHLSLIGAGKDNFIAKFLGKVIFAIILCLLLLCIISSSINLYIWKRAAKASNANAANTNASNTLAVNALRTFRRFFFCNLLWNILWLALYISFFALFKLEFAVKAFLFAALFYLILNAVLKVTFEQEKSLFGNIATTLSLFLKKLHLFIVLIIITGILFFVFGLILYLPVTIFSFSMAIASSISFILTIISIVFIKYYFALAIVSYDIPRYRGRNIYKE